MLLLLQVMDETAITLCKENNIPVIVFNAMQPGNILRAAMGEDVGTVVTHAEKALAAATPRIRIAEAVGTGSDEFTDE
jgi:glutamate 5-kinase